MTQDDKPAASARAIAYTLFTMGLVPDMSTETMAKVYCLLKEEEQAQGREQS
jgi:hypothetical protein